MKDSQNSKDDKTCNSCENCRCSGSSKWQYRHHSKAAGGGAVYGLGFVGALLYFVGQATSFWLGVLAVLKAIVWPAFLVYEALKFLTH